MTKKGKQAQRFKKKITKCISCSAVKKMIKFPKKGLPGVQYIIIKKTTVQLAKPNEVRLILLYLLPISFPGTLSHKFLA